MSFEPGQFVRYRSGAGARDARIRSAIGDRFFYISLPREKRSRLVHESLLLPFEGRVHIMHRDPSLFELLDE